MTIEFRDEFLEDLRAILDKHKKMNLVEVLAVCVFKKIDSAGGDVSLGHVTTDKEESGLGELSEIIRAYLKSNQAKQN